MNMLKRFVGFLLAAMMVLSVAGMALAADTGTITVDNPKDGETYTAYKIFDVTYATATGGEKSYSYSISGTSEWYDIVNAYTEGFTLTKAATGNTYIVAKKDSFSAADFAAKLKENIADKTGTPLTTDGTGVSAKNLQLGYYFVASTNGALCNLTTTNPTVTIHDKNDVPFEKTEDKTTADVGETVSYTITGKVPDATGFQSYVYKIEDTMSEGLTFQKNSVTVTGLSDGEYTLTTKDDGFTLIMNVMDIQAKVGKGFTIEYTAITNEKAIAVVSKNTAKLTYSNHPTDSTKTTEITKEVPVHTAKIVINKYKEGAEGTKLEHAKFVLKNEDKTLYYKYTAATADTPAKVEWVTSKEQATVKETNADGAADFPGLKDGTYYLEETEAPAGYNLLTKDVEIVINGASATDADLKSLTVEAKVANNTGLVLPETGGMGTTIFYAAGGAMVVGAVVLLITKKRMNSGK